MRKLYEKIRAVRDAPYESGIAIPGTTEPPLLQSLSQAPLEDDEITPETAAALDRARASLARGEGMAHEDILHEFGLTK